jgi:Ion channel
MSFINRTFDSESKLLLIFVLLITLFALTALCNKIFWLAKLAIWSTNLYLVLVLIFAAIRSDGLQESKSYTPPKFVKWFFPTRLVGLGMFILLAYALVKAFAALYLQLETTDHFSQAISSPEDATYFSLVTITTLGYGEFYPVSEPAKSLVVFQLSSGLLLLFGVFPLLISRISGFTGNA